ncbi:MAG TPA: hypothetical protein VGF07_13225 [Stellaceae bacterium]|jgi:hypothetical protein
MQTAHSRIAESTPPFLYIGAPERAAIRRLKQAAAATPLGLAETATLLARQRRGEGIADPPAWTVALRFGFFASYRIEDWPDGRWQRLSIRAPGSRLAPGVAAVLLGEFGFAAMRLGENIVWRGAGAVLHIAERLGPLPEGAGPVAAPGPEAPLAEPDPAEITPDDDDDGEGEEP